jgi:glycerol-3-phosphate O-acyltransferase 3/4
MLKLRNLTLLRRLYVNLLALMTRIAYGADAVARRPPTREGAAHESRIRRINSELEFGPGVWEGSFLEAFAFPGPGADAEVPAEATAAAVAAAAAAMAAAAAGGSPMPPARNGRDTKKQALPFELGDVGACIGDGVDAIVGDSLTRCFTTEPSEPWNFLTRNLQPGQWTPNPYATLLWLLGLWVRYCILLPIRFAVLLGGFVSFIFAYPLVGILIPKSRADLQVVLRKWLLRYLASAFVASWSGYIRYHGTRPSPQPDQIYVANHTSLIDVFVLTKDYNFSCIGQRHTGLAGALQDLLVTAQDHVWFDREEGRDRKAVQSMLKAHVANGTKEPMLVFPEGTCTTTDYCIMFKKGSFELGAKVYPIAMRYRKEFGDAYWNSSQAAFPRHLFDLMTSWAVVCDVHYLPPMTIDEGETTVQFAGRVKRKICESAHLIDVNWDGFLKRHRISTKFLEQRQKAFAAVIMRRMRGEVPRPCSTSTLHTMQKSSPTCSPASSTSEIARQHRLELAMSRSRSIPSEMHNTGIPTSNGTGNGMLSAAAAARLQFVRRPARRAAAALSFAARESFRWGLAFTLLAVAGAITAVFVPNSWRDAWKALMLHT